jgi:hypothetical protein
LTGDEVSVSDDFVKNFTSVLDRDFRRAKISIPASVSGRDIRAGDETKFTVEI